MPIWSEVLEEIKAENTISAFDNVRRRYLNKLYKKTDREIILYATAFTQKTSGVSPGDFTIADEDIQGIMEVIHGLTGPNLDLIIHSPGGSIEAAEAIVRYLRSKFEHIRVIVPVQAMSAAAMIACSADKIVMGKHSFLGPVDPQMVLQTDLGPRMVPADAIIEQFDRAIVECQDPKKLAAWAPMLRQYGPDLLQRCENARELSRTLVTEWLEKYMFRSDPNAKAKATDIGSWLSNHGTHKTHGRHLGRDTLESKGLDIEHLENDQEFQDLVLSVFHATTHTFSSTAATKIIENHRGNAFVKIIQQVQIQLPQQQSQ